MPTKALVLTATEFHRSRSDKEIVVLPAYDARWIRKVESVGDDYMPMEERDTVIVGQGLYFESPAGPGWTDGASIRVVGPPMPLIGTTPGAMAKWLRDLAEGCDRAQADNARLAAAKEDWPP